MIQKIVRGVVLLGLAALGYTFVAIPSVSAQTAAPVTFMTAGEGSAFLPYGRGIAIEVKKSAGSNENLSGVDASATTIGTAFIGSAHDAVNGTGWAAGHKHENVRALFPMYETSFQIGVLRNSAIRSLADLDGKKVGVGPAKGPAEMFFRAASEVANIKPVIVNGDPAALSKSLISGEIDALWQGAVVPIPSLVDVADHADAIVFGFSDAEVAAMLRKLPQLAATTVPASTYRGQTADIRSVSAWNVVVANKDLSDDTAYAITKAVLSAPDPKSQIYPTAAGTLARNAANNRVMPFHPGAIRFYDEAGIKLPSP
jgi:uncharacterized protein